MVLLLGIPLSFLNYPVSVLYTQCKLADGNLEEIHHNEKMKTNKYVECDKELEETTSDQVLEFWAS